MSYAYERNDRIDVMKKQTAKRQGVEEMTLFGMEAEIRLGKKNQLMKLTQILDWGRIEKILEPLKGSGKGQQPYDVLKMFKSILLGQWYSLSDPMLEESLRVRLDFMQFTGFELMEAVPDETTLCRFRNEMSQRGMDKELFVEINRQLEEKNLKVKGCNGAIIDATVVESAARPKRVIEEIVEDRQEEEMESQAEEKEPAETQYRQTESCDPDARWLKKGNRCYFGYKGFMRVDDEDGYIEHVHAKSANESEVKELPALLNGVKDRRLYADKAYASKTNDAQLSTAHIKNGIMSKASRGHPLNHWQKIRNRLISKVRFRVEQSFGTLKRRFHFHRASYFGILKVETQMRLKAICYNLLKAARKVEWAV